VLYLINFIYSVLYSFGKGRCCLALRFIYLARIRVRVPQLARRRRRRQDTRSYLTSSSRCHCLAETSHSHREFARSPRTHPEVKLLTRHFIRQDMAHKHSTPLQTNRRTTFFWQKQGKLMLQILKSRTDFESSS
jgi:hypothetical protein